MAKLFVSGCSFSDYTLVEKNWGENLAALIGMEYVHMNKGGGSNDRGWREISWKIIQGEITTQDLVILQYTNIDRREFGATEIGYEDRQPKEFYHKEKFCNSLGTFYTTAYKCGSHVWQSSDWDAKLHQAYEHTGAISDRYNDCHFITQHMMFDSLCKQYGINIMYMRTRYMYDELEFPADNIFYEHHHLPVQGQDDTMLGYAEGHPDQGRYDTSHLSEYGHAVLAQLVRQYLIEQGMISDVETSR